MWMTWKTALLELPFGGAKEAVRCDPARLSDAELERITRRYTTEIAPWIGPDRNILAPDLNTGEREMAWVMDTFSARTGAPAIGTAVTGKPTWSAARRSAGRRAASGSPSACGWESQRWACGRAGAGCDRRLRQRGQGRRGGTRARSRVPDRRRIRRRGGRWRSRGLPGRQAGGRASGGSRARRLCGGGSRSARRHIASASSGCPVLTWREDCIRSRVATVLSGRVAPPTPTPSRRRLGRRAR